MTDHTADVLAAVLVVDDEEDSLDTYRRRFQAAALVACVRQLTQRPA